MQLRLTFNQILADADGVFIGTVVTQNCRLAATGRMIFTDVEFAVGDWIGLPGARQATAPGTNNIVLSFAGGEMGGLGCKVSDVPAFKTGLTYLIFTKLDGRQYASPVAGAYQGLFKVYKDPVTGQQYPATYGDEVVLGVGPKELVLGPRIEGVSAGVPRLERNKELRPNFHDVAPVAVGGNPAHEAKVSSVAKAYATPPAPMPLDQFVREIKERLTKVQREKSAR